MHGRYQHPSPAFSSAHQLFYSWKYIVYVSDRSKARLNEHSRRTPTALVGLDTFEVPRLSPEILQATKPTGYLQLQTTSTAGTSASNSVRKQSKTPHRHTHRKVGHDVELFLQPLGDNFGLGDLDSLLFLLLFRLFLLFILRCLFFCVTRFILVFPTFCCCRCYWCCSRCCFVPLLVRGIGGNRDGIGISRVACSSSREAVGAVYAESVWADSP